jgi:hypothetical protein
MLEKVYATALYRDFAVAEAAQRRGGPGLLNEGDR